MNECTSDRKNRKANNRNNNYDNGDSMKPNTVYEAYPIVRKT